MAAVASGEDTMKKEINNLIEKLKKLLLKEIDIWSSSDPLAPPAKYKYKHLIENSTYDVGYNMFGTPFADGENFMAILMKHGAVSESKFNEIRDSLIDWVNKPGNIKNKNIKKYFTETIKSVFENAWKERQEENAFNEWYATANEKHAYEIAASEIETSGKFNLFEPLMTKNEVNAHEAAKEAAIRARAQQILAGFATATGGGSAGAFGGGSAKPTRRRRGRKARKTRRYRR